MNFKDLKPNKIIGKTIFGILHLDIITIDTKYDTKICLHTRYGNIYLVRKREGSCFTCCGNGFCTSGVPVHCCCTLIKKYNKQNKKVLKRFIPDIVEEQLKYSDNFNAIEWKEFFEKKISEILNMAE